ncbi:MAG TPA: efflux RND transporter permease subunit [Brumimicrobium sp.]|nr:efflux RND transporter permease subunit [Brumimicrobium sp.]
MLKNIVTKPIQAVVLALVLVFLGTLGMSRLSITRFPEIAPPSVQVSVSFPGASSETVAQSVLVPIEEAINGVDGMTYMESRASNSGSGVINIFFESGTDPDQASVAVQTRVSQATSEVPTEVIQSGISVIPRQRGNIMTINLYSDRDDDAYDETFIQAYAMLNVNREILRVPGVARVSRVGARNYAMRIWLNPEKIAAYGLTPQEVMNAVKEQNFEIAPGKFGEASDKVFEIPLRHKGRFSLPEEYENIPIRANPDRSILYLKDIARVEFGASNLGANNSVNGQPGLTLNLTQTAGSNARSIDENVREVLENISKSFPPGIKYDITYSVKEQIDESISQVRTTIFEAFILVFIIVFIFLQNIRSTIIPVITIPVSLLGTFFFIYLLGFSINVLTMFAIVLAIGIVVDDAIIIVEAIYEKMQRAGKSAKEATLETLNEMRKVIISIAMVMIAVLAPVGFMEGPAGVFYKQFAYTLAVAILISALIAITLIPALSALFLKTGRSSKKKKRNRKRPFLIKGKYILRNFFNKFNALFDRFLKWYELKVTYLIRKSRVTIAILLGSILLGGILMTYTPGEFIPTEDDSFITVSIALQPGASLARTQKTLDKAEGILKQRKDIDGITTISGYNPIDNTPNSSFAVVYVNLKPIKNRGKVKKIDKIISSIHSELSTIDEATFQVYPRPTVQGFGDFSGIEIMLQDRFGGSFNDFEEVAQNFINELDQDASVARAFTSFNAKFPQYILDIDYIKAKTLGVNVNDLMRTIRAYYGRVQMGDFSRFGRQYRVYFQADMEYRSSPATFGNIFVKNKDGEMLPANTLVTLRSIQGPETVNRYNLFNTIPIKITPSQGNSSGDVLATVERLSSNLPANYSYELTGMALEEKESAGQMAFIFGVSILFVYLLLVAQYESFILPLSILIIVPTSFLGIYTAINLVGVTNNIYVQVGTIMLIGLLSKNAILIVEYALQQRRKGHEIIDAALQGAMLRVRPILMTTFAFIAGLTPLMFAVGPSAKGNQSISIGTSGGLLIGVIITIFVVPALFVFFQRIDEKIKFKFKNEN